MIGFFVAQVVGRRTRTAPDQPSPRPRPVEPSIRAVAASTDAAGAEWPGGGPAPTGASTGLGGDMQTQKPKEVGRHASAGTIGDGLEPPPVVFPAAPKLGKIGDAAALPTVDAGCEE